MQTGLLQGWKAIASYLERDERTVRRWEKQYGLPIRRLTSDRKSVVYAVRSELDEWLLEPRSIQADMSPPSGQHDLSPESSEQVTQPENALTAEARMVSASRIYLALMIVLIVLLCVAAARFLHGATWSTRKTPKATDELHSSAELDVSVLEGELLLDRRTPASMNRAVDVLTRRTQQAPMDASAYATLSKALCLIREYSTTPSYLAYPPAEDAARHALLLDPQNSDADASSGFIDFFWKWDAPSAERHFQRAIALRPDSATAHQWYGSMLLHQGRTQEALRELNQAQRLAPSSIPIVSTRAMALSLSGQRLAAEEILKKLEEDAPEALPPYRTSAYLSLQHPPRWSDYLDQIERFDQLRGDRAGVSEIAHARKIFRAQGQREMLMFLLAQERLRSMDEHHPSFGMARLEALLGENDAACLHVLLAVKHHDDNAIALLIDPVFEPLRRQGKLEEALKLLPGPLLRD